MIRLASLLAAIALLPACGFQPLYAGSDFSGVNSSGIQIAEIPGRSGYMLRRELMRELSVGLPNLEEPAQLTISLSESYPRIALFPDGGVSRSYYDGRANYVLATGDSTLNGSAGVQVPFAAAPSPFADVAAQTQSAKQGMQLLARRIVADLRIQLQNADDTDTRQPDPTKK
tara:strand:+ start:693 stop:1208 length:516 start_codon:yes stop_codon:yes gene_type:complete